MPVLSRLVPVFASAFGLQTVLAAIFVPQANEMFYDLGGAAGFLSTTFISLYYPALKAKYWHKHPVSLPNISSFAPRQLLLTAALGIWSARLGSFLVQRAIKAGGDSRFDEVKHQPSRFTFFWMAQAVWVLLVGMPVYLVNTLPSSTVPALRTRDYLAVGLYATSLAFEVVADRQKSAWRKAKDAKQHDEKFITRGLWSISRHPNYIGEIGIWTGVWALSMAALPAGSIAFAALSPLTTYFLLRKVSGVPPLERAGDKKFGGDPKWEEYKRTVPIFWPWGRAGSL